MHPLRLCLLPFLLLDAAVPGADDRVDHVLVLKSERLLFLMQGGRVVHRFSIALGGQPIGHKEREGDGRTPEGRYVLDWHKADSSYYRALHVSYPQQADRDHAKAMNVSPGGDIMVHGTPNRAPGLGFLLQWFDWTNGCIALDNAAMKVVFDTVADGTPIEIRP